MLYLSISLKLQLKLIFFRLSCSFMCRIIRCFQTSELKGYGHKKLKKENSRNLIKIHVHPQNLLSSKIFDICHLQGTIRAKKSRKPPQNDQKLNFPELNGGFWIFRNLIYSDFWLLDLKILLVFRDFIINYPWEIKKDLNNV